MNNSGEALRQAAAFYKIPPARVIVIFDDITLPPGKLRIRAKGSDGGHNGVKSIIQHLGSQDFPRIKIGVGGPAHEDHEIVDYVTGNIPDRDKKDIFSALERACDALLLILAARFEEAMGRYN